MFWKLKRALAVGCAFIALCVLAFPYPAAAQGPPVPVGIAALVDGASILDRIELRLSGLTPAPPGAAYRVWLRSDDQALVVPAGDVTLDESGAGAFGWSQPAGESLFIQFSEVLVTLETGARGAQPGPIVLRGQVDAGALSQFRRLLVRWPDSRYGTASLQGLRQLSASAHVHAVILREAAATGDLIAMRRKAEHLVNLMEGTRGATFGDHDGDRRAEDPGDGVGFLPYAWGALTQTQFAWAGAADEQVAEASLAVQPAVRFALAWAGFARDTGLELAQTRDAALAYDLAGHLFTAVQRLASAIDPGQDAALRQMGEERELVPAYDTGLTLVQVALLPPGSTIITTETGANGG